MWDNQSEVFTGRREANALFRKLCNLEPQYGFPFLTFLAPGGGGKTMLLKALSDLCRSELPYAYLDFTRANYHRELHRALIELCEQLQQTSGELHRKLDFPRFFLGASIIHASLSDNPVTLRREILEELTKNRPFIDTLDDIGQSLANIAPPIPPITTLIRRILNSQQGIQRRWGKYLQWYKNNGENLFSPAVGDEYDVLKHLRILSRSNKVSERQKVERLLFAAFLEDLGSDNKSPARVVLFLDGFEAVTNDENTMGLDLLKWLTGHRKKKADPLLLVIGSQRRLFNISEAEQNPPFDEHTPLPNEQAIQEYIQERYTAWEQQLPPENERSNLEARHLHLPLYLPDFGKIYIRDYLHRPSEQHLLLGEETRVEELYRITHGHPLTLALVMGAVHNAERHHLLLRLDHIEQESVPPDLVPDHEHHTIETYLLSIFLRQLSDTDRKNLLICAIPRTIPQKQKIAILKEVLQITEDVERLWDRYCHFTFVSVTEELLVIHPVVRRLLLKHLQKEQSVSIHRRLHTYFGTLAESGDEPAVLEHAYHALGLGNPTPAIKLAIKLASSTLHDICALDDLLKVIEQASPIEPELVAKIENHAIEARHEVERRQNQAEQPQDLESCAIALVLYRWLMNTSWDDQRRATRIRQYFENACDSFIQQTKIAKDCVK